MECIPAGARRSQGGKRAVRETGKTEEAEETEKAEKAEEKEETKDLLLKVLDGEMDKDAVMEAMGM